MPEKLRINRRYSRPGFLFIILVLFLSLIVGFQTAGQEINTDEEALFGALDDGVIGGGAGESSSEGSDEGGEPGSEEELFAASDDFLVTMEGAVNVDTGSTALLIGDETEIGGRFTFTTESQFNGEDFSDTENSLELLADIYLDARPDENFRVFIKSTLAWPFEEGETGGSDGGGGTGELTGGAGTAENEPFSVTEAFADTTIEDVLFVRAGKQNATWGVGYFFSPANILNLTKIDPEEPEEELEGPVAVKLQLPVGVHNLYLYTDLDELVSKQTIGVAPKFEYVINDSEIGLGAYWRYDEPAAGMITLTTSIGDFGLFGEAVLQYGGTSNYVDEQAGVYDITTRNNELFFLGTAGFTWLNEDEEDRFDLSIHGQYYFNGEGYEDSSYLSDPAVLGLLASGELTQADLLETGRHYAAGAINWTEMFGSDLSSHLFGIGNLSDNSGKADISLSYTGIENIDLVLGYSRTFGDEGDQFTPKGAAATIYIGTSIGTGSF